MCYPDKKDKSGNTPYDLAKKHGHTGVIEYLDKATRTYSDTYDHLVRPLQNYVRRVQPTGKHIGQGAYSEVLEVSSGKGEVFAAKLFKTSNNLSCLHMGKLAKELKIMMDVNHEHIVQSKGMGFLEDSPVPVLLMEQLMSNVNDFLLHPQNPKTVSLERKVSILRDTASGLKYLHTHTPAIIHRDLTAKNVLLDSTLKAKITDFGNSQLMELDPEITPQTVTCLPGTLNYMPPEANMQQYDPSLDVFSFGHLALFTLVQKCIELLPATYVDTSTQDKPHGRSEVKRRGIYMKKAAERLMSKNHPLLVLIKKCLHNHPSQRPHAIFLLSRLRNDTMVQQGPDESDHEVEESDTSSVSMDRLIASTDKVPIRGAEIVAKISVDIYPNKPLHLDWEDHGLTLDIPSDAVKTNTAPVRMTIQASLSGQYSFPPDMELVSGIYWISFPERFSKPVTLNMQHCCHIQNMEQASELHFVSAKCTQENLPYKFEPKPTSTGIFSTQSCYGAVELEHFSGVGIGQKRKRSEGKSQMSKRKKDQWNRTYSAQSYHLRKDNTDWLVEIPVTKDLKLFKTVIENLYKEKRGIPGPFLSIQRDDLFGYQQRVTKSWMEGLVSNKTEGEAIMGYLY